MSSPNFHTNSYILTTVIDTKSYLMLELPVTQVAHLHGGACQQITKKFLSFMFCAEILQQFPPTPKGY